jgi:hypothetical protein
VKHQPDLNMAERFLAQIRVDDLLALDYDYEFTFQTADDNKKRKSPALAKIFHGKLAQHAKALAALNNRGAAVYVMVNRGDGKGRKAQNVVEVRALFVDLDGAPLDPVLKAKAKPHVIVQSSPGRWHAYWRVCDCSLAQFTPFQHALAERFNGDPSVADLPHVMRLPGFWHLKEAPFRTEIVES